MKVILNIGLEVSSTGAQFHPAFALDYAEHCLGTKAAAHAVVESDTEPALVVELECSRQPGEVARSVEILAHCLSQDCIALYTPHDDDGKLLGPRAAAWGDFSPGQFFLLDGTRLSTKRAALSA